MNFLLNKKREHEELCEKEIRADQISKAVFHAAKAAEFAFALAQQTGGVIAERYIEDAEGWVEIAERMKNSPAKKISRNQNKEKATREPSARDDEDSPANEDWLVAAKPTISFDDIAGMEEAKKSIREMVIYPLQHMDKAEALGLKPGGGVILYGPPGNGKTMIGKAIASELDAPFYHASGAQVRSKWHGESEQRLRKLIQAATSHDVAVLFFDEVEGLLPRRGGNSVVDNRIVTQFLAEIGGFEDRDSTLLLLGATNCPWDIDDAVFRTGRFDEKIYIAPPDVTAREAILRMKLGDSALEQSFDIPTWAETLEGYTGSDIVGIVNGAKRAALGRSIANESTPEIQGSDLTNAMQRIPTSAPEKLLKKYAQFRETRF